MSNLLKELTIFQNEIIEKEKRTNQGCCLFLTMGSGKTRVAIELIKKFKAKRILIVSKSKLVRDTWPNQLQKWNATQYKYLCLANKPATFQEQRMLEGIAEYTIVGTNFESFSRSTTTKIRPKRVNLKESPMLYAYEKIPWDVIIIDESTCIKDPTSNIALAMLNLTYNSPQAYVMSLTGTPNPEESLDFYTQITIVDRGDRFGQSFTEWRNKYFYQPKHSFNWIPFPFGAGGKSIGEVIADLCKDICYVLTKDEYARMAKLLPRKTFDIYFKLDDKTYDKYKEMKSNIISLPDRDITAANAAIVINKLLQLSSGFVYDNEREKKRDAFFFGINKITEVISLIKKLEGKVIVCYNFQESRDILQLHLDLNNIVYAMDNETTEEEFDNSKTIKVLLLQPRSGAYGTNRQKDCNKMIWFELTDSGEKFQQTEARIERPGQTKECEFYYMLGINTHDKITRDTTRNKDATATTVLKAIKTAAQTHNDTINIKKNTDTKLLEEWYLLEDMFL